MIVNSNLLVLLFVVCFLIFLLYVLYRLDQWHYLNELELEQRRSGK